MEFHAGSNYMNWLWIDIFCREDEILHCEQEDEEFFAMLIVIAGHRMGEMYDACTYQSKVNFSFYNIQMTKGSTLLETQYNT